MISRNFRIANARLGALKRNMLYGNPGTPEGRARGGKTTIRKFNQNPRLAKKLGFIIRKKINYPQKGINLAELFGVILGDGGLPGNHQLIISFNNKTDREYSLYLNSLLQRLFHVNGNILYRKGNNGADIVVSSSNLVDFLLREGLCSGNKVKNQVGIPAWIRRKPEYEKACLRGLMDTDGSFYCHKYISGGRKYKYLKLCFTNCSKPILKFVFDVLRDLDYQAYLDGNHVSIYSVGGIKRYFKEIGTNNQKHLKKLQGYLSN